VSSLRFTLQKEGRAAGRTLATGHDEEAEAAMRDRAARAVRVRERNMVVVMSNEGVKGRMNDKECNGGKKEGKERRGKQGQTDSGRVFPFPRCGTGSNDRAKVQ